MVLDRLLDDAASARTEAIVMGLSGSVADTLHALNILQQMPEGRRVDTLAEARDIAAGLLYKAPSSEGRAARLSPRAGAW